MRQLRALICFNLFFASTHLVAYAQPVGVPIYKQGRQELVEKTALEKAAEQIRTEGKSLQSGAMAEQLRHATSQLNLPLPDSQKLTSREIWQRARKSHLRIGWSYLCTKCDQWHLNLAGGFALTTNGVAVTCYHVVQPDRNVREGTLVAANDDGQMFAVTEVLAANRYADTCIVRIAGEGFTPLPLSTNLYPGDAVFCFSDPLDRRGYFSQGIVNRFYQMPARRRMSAPTGSSFLPLRINVSTDWAPGSSGSAVLDENGNAVGVVSTISAAGDDEPSETSKGEPNTLIVFHEAVSARDILALIKPVK